MRAKGGVKNPVTFRADFGMPARDAPAPESGLAEVSDFGNGTVW
jgi:hypothetical protein